tara:strand:- start:136 stop:459 length:324 start_codon:yes stop_codon:yes gene_type:complete
MKGVTKGQAKGESIFVILGQVGAVFVIVISTIVGAILTIIKGPIFTAGNDIGAGPGGLLIHLIFYGAIGAGIGMMVGGLIVSLGVFLWYRVKKKDEQIQTRHSDSGR